MDDNTENHNENSWERLWRELVRRTCGPFKHVSFVIYFLVATVIIGGIGFWLELYVYVFSAQPKPENIDPLLAMRTAVTTFFPALTGTACLQLIWAEDHRKPLRAFGVFFLVIMTIVALVIAPTQFITSNSALTVGFVASLASLWAWWIANAEQKDLLDDIDPDDSIGGKKVDVDLPGNLDGFTV